MAERKSKETRKIEPDPGPLMGFFAEQFYTFVLFAAERRDYVHLSARGCAFVQ